MQLAVALRAGSTAAASAPPHFYRRSAAARAGCASETSNIRRRSHQKTRGNVLQRLTCSSENLGLCAMSPSPSLAGSGVAPAPAPSSGALADISRPDRDGADIYQTSTRSTTSYCKIQGETNRATADVRRRAQRRGWMCAAEVGRDNSRTKKRSKLRSPQNHTMARLTPGRTLASSVAHCCVPEETPPAEGLAAPKTARTRMNPT